MLGVPAHVLVVRVGGPTPGSGLRTRKQSRHAKRLHINLFGIGSCDLIFEMGEVPFDRTDADCLEVDEAGVPPTDRTFSRCGSTRVPRASGATARSSNATRHGRHGRVPARMRACPGNRAREGAPRRSSATSCRTPRESRAGSHAGDGARSLPIELTARSWDLAVRSPRSSPRTRRPDAPPLGSPVQAPPPRHPGPPSTGPPSTRGPIGRARQPWPPRPTAEATRPHCSWPAARPGRSVSAEQRPVGGRFHRSRGEAPVPLSTDRVAGGAG
jgi:hypothetical protein